MSAAIPLWVVWFCVGLVQCVVLFTRAVEFYTTLSFVSLALFVAAVILTVREENARHAQGHPGLGPAGICAIVSSLTSLVIGTVVFSIYHPQYKKTLMTFMDT